MSPLARVLVAKIAMTVGAWCVPLLLFPAGWLAGLGFDVPQPMIFLRLLGMAYLALCLGYAFGLVEERNGRDPEPVVWVGILSNGGACLMLIGAAALGSWAAWGPVARGFMWASLLGTGTITLGLLRYGVFREGAGGVARSGIDSSTASGH